MTVKKKQASKTTGRERLMKDPNAVILKPAHWKTLASVIIDSHQKKIDIQTVAVSPDALYVEFEEKNGHITGVHKIMMS